MSPSLDHPLTGKSISVSFAFALRACVRACEAAWVTVSIMICVVRGGSCDFPGSPGSGPAPPPPRLVAYSFLGLSGPVWALPGLVKSKKKQKEKRPAWACLGLPGAVWACLGTL